MNEKINTYHVQLIDNLGLPSQITIFFFLLVLQIYPIGISITAFSLCFR